MLGQVKALLLPRLGLNQTAANVRLIALSDFDQIARHLAEALLNRQAASIG